MHEGIQEADAQCLDSVLRDDPILTFEQWAERFLEIENQRFAFRPYQIQPARDLFNPRAQYVALRMYSGAGKTYLMTAAVCYAVHQLGLSVGKGFPADRDAKKWMERKLDPFLRETPIMAKMPFLRKRDDKVQEKRWMSGSSVEAIGLNSPGGVRTTELDICDADEIDALKSDSGDEGDKLRLFWRRTRGRMRQYHWASSYPSLKRHSKIDTLYDQSNQARWIVQCAHCSSDIEMTTDLIRIPKTGPIHAEIECPECARMINDDQRLQMAMGGAWKDDKGDRVTCDFGPENAKRGYHIDCTNHVGHHDEAFPSYLAEVAESIASIETADNPEKARREFSNTMAAKSYEPPAMVQLNVPELVRRREKYDPHKELPVGVLMLTIGADVQGNRVELEVVGHGDNGQTWGCGYHVIHGPPDRPSTWAQVKEAMLATWKHPDYGEMRSARSFIDSQYRQSDVFAFCRGLMSRGIFPVFGSPRPTAPAVGKASVNNRLRVKVYPLGTNELKSMIYHALERSNPDDQSFMHYPALDEYDAGYFEQLTAEEPEWIDGVEVFRNRENRRNEALDVRGYALAARLSFTVNFVTIRENLEAKISPKKRPKLGIKGLPKGPKKGKWL